MNKLVVGALAALALLPPAAANAVTLTFDELTIATGYTQLASQGFVIAPTPFVLASSFGVAPSVFGGDPSDRAVSALTLRATRIVSATGQRFDFSSIRVAEAFNNGASPTAFDAVLAFYRSDDPTFETPTTQVIHVDNLPGLQTFAFNETGLTQLTITPLLRLIQFDNIVVTPQAPPGAGVPEPAAWALMLAGFAAAGSRLRRRRAATTA